MTDPLVTVVIPAYNAEATLEATIETVLAQTLRDVEIVIVDDGSTDRTNDIAHSFAAANPRIRVITTANRGVAAARNTGIRAAAAPYVAPLDADDLWHPEKLERQLACLADSPDVSLVYSGYRLIDADDMVLSTPSRPRLEGSVFHRFIVRNIVGNGSAILFRRSQALAIGGYDTRMHEQGVQGCEDYLLQVKLAALGHVRYARGYLIGYRKTPGAMSADVPRMVRGRIAALKLIAEECAPGRSTALATLAQYRIRHAFWFASGGKWRLAGELMSGWLKEATIGSLLGAVHYFCYLLIKRLLGPISRPEGTSCAFRKYAEYAADEETDIICVDYALPRTKWLTAKAALIDEMEPPPDQREKAQLGGKRTG